MSIKLYVHITISLETSLGYILKPPKYFDKMISRKITEEHEHPKGGGFPAQVPFL